MSNKFKASLCACFSIAALLFPLFRIQTAQASIRFLTLPFSDTDIKIQQGYVYTCYPSCGNHQGIDYIKGKIDDSSTWQKFDVRAAADGEAIFTKWNPSSKSGDEFWGNYVRIKHQQGSEVYYTLYAHLDSSTMAENTKVKVKHGDIIGKSGKTGSGSNEIIHLHFEFSKNLWGVGNRLDAYDLYTTRSKYPGWSYSGLGPNNFWLNDPPTPYVPEVKFATTPPDYDNIGSVLTKMNYVSTELQQSNLADVTTLSKYKAIFINCARTVNSTPEIIAAIQKYVQGGGSLYASDWAYEYIRDAFPGYVTFADNPKIGLSQSTKANIVDDGLRNYLNPSSPVSSIELNYDLPAWVVIDSVSPQVKVYVKGQVDVRDNALGNNKLSHEKVRSQSQTPEKTITDKPLVVSFRPYQDGGNVIFTTFHNEAQQTNIEKKLLEYLVLLPITQSQQQQIISSMVSNRLTLARTDVNVINPNETSGSYTYTSASSSISSALAFVLAWPGSALQLSVYRPNGNLYKQVASSDSPITIKIPNAEIGQWKYQVRSIYVPYDNYPYAVGIGEFAPRNMYVPLVASQRNDSPPAPTMTSTPTDGAVIPAIDKPVGAINFDEADPVTGNSYRAITILIAAEEETKMNIADFTSDCGITSLPTGLATTPLTSYMVKARIFVPKEAEGKTCTLASVVTTSGDVYPQTTLSLSLQFAVQHTIVPTNTPTRTPTNTPTPTITPTPTKFTLTRYIASDNGDGYEDPTFHISGDGNRNDYIGTASDVMMGTIFSNITIPQGAHITKATFQCRGFGLDGTSTARVRAFAEDNTGQFNADGSNKPSARAVTNAYVDWTNNWTFQFQDFQSPNLASIIQEVVNRSGWSSSNTIGLRITNPSGTGTNWACVDYAAGKYSDSFPQGHRTSLTIMYEK